MDIKYTSDDSLTLHEEKRLIERCWNDDDSAFEEIVNRYKDYVYNFAYRLLDDPDDAEDLAQDVFLTCFRHFKRFRGDCRISTWLFHITHNLAKNKWQKDKSQRRSSHQSIDEPLDSSMNSMPMELPDRKPDPVRIAIAREEMEFLQKCISSLPEEQRELIALRFQEYLSYEDIAKVLSCSVGTVKSRLHRVRKELKILMTEMVSKK